MALPLFFHDAPTQQGQTLWLAEDTARHVVQVLRMQPGEALRLTDGKGSITTVTITTTDKKKCSALVQDVVTTPPPAYPLHLAIAFTKNTARNEWLLEKATEIGVRTIIPLQAARREKERIRPERWQQILISAMLQSQQAYVPLLEAPLTLPQLWQQYAHVSQKLLAHCLTESPRIPLLEACKPQRETLICIGPEGDFNIDEIEAAEAAGATAVSLGHRRLRTETAAMSVCTYYNLLNDEKTI